MRLIIIIALLSVCVGLLVLYQIRQKQLVKKKEVRFVEPLPTQYVHSKRVERTPPSFSAKMSREDRYSPYIPYNALSSRSHYLQLGRKELSVKRQKETFVVEGMKGEYRPRPGKLLTGQEVVPTETVVDKIQRHVCALSAGEGKPFASALLVAPDLVLTARHCVEERNIASLNIRTHYVHMLDGNCYRGSAVKVAGVIEDNEHLDYALLKLSQPIPDFDTYPPLSFSWNDHFTGPAIFIHHPDGEPKKYSVHATFESDYQRYTYSGFQESWEGSSGGVYVDEEGHVFALHLLYEHGVSARWMRHIYQESGVLQALFDRNGNAKKSASDFSQRELQYFLPESEFSKKYRDSLEVKSEKPCEYSEGNMRLGLFGYEGKDYLQKRHHIIPDGDMQFLWVLGQEYPSLKDILHEMAFQTKGQVITTDTINAMEYAPWNLFIGPASRGDDPGDKRETECPPGFDHEFWEILQNLADQLQMCWEVRYEFCLKIGKTEKKNWEDFKSEQIRLFAQYHSNNSKKDKNKQPIPPRTITQIPDKKKLFHQNGKDIEVEELKKIYLDSIQKLIPLLEKIDARYKQICVEKGAAYMYQTTEKDWTLSDDGKFQLNTAAIPHTPICSLM